MHAARLCCALFLFIPRPLFKFLFPWLGSLKSIAVTMSETALNFMLLRFAE